MTTKTMIAKIVIFMTLFNRMGTALPEKPSSDPAAIVAAPANENLAFDLLTTPAVSSTESDSQTPTETEKKVLTDSDDKTGAGLINRLKGQLNAALCSVIYCPNTPKDTEDPDKDLPDSHTGDGAGTSSSLRGALPTFSDDSNLEKEERIYVSKEQSKDIVPAEEETETETETEIENPSTETAEGANKKDSEKMNELEKDRDEAEKETEKSRPQENNVGDDAQNGHLVTQTRSGSYETPDGGVGVWQTVRQFWSSNEPGAATERAQSEGDEKAPFLLSPSRVFADLLRWIGVPSDETDDSKTTTAAASYSSSSSSSTSSSSSSSSSSFSSLFPEPTVTEADEYSDEYYDQYSDSYPYSDAYYYYYSYNYYDDDSALADSAHSDENDHRSNDLVNYPYAEDDGSYYYDDQNYADDQSYYNDNYDDYGGQLSRLEDAWYSDAPNWASTEYSPVGFVHDFPRSHFRVGRAGRALGAHLDRVKPVEEKKGEKEAEKKMRVSEVREEEKVLPAVAGRESKAEHPAQQESEDGLKHEKKVHRLRQPEGQQDLQQPPEHREHSMHRIRGGGGGSVSKVEKDVENEAEKEAEKEARMHRALRTLLRRRKDANDTSAGAVLEAAEAAPGREEHKEEMSKGAAIGAVDSAAGHAENKKDDIKA